MDLSKSYLLRIIFICYLSCSFLFEAVFQSCNHQNQFLLILCFCIITWDLPKSSTRMCKRNLMAALFLEGILIRMVNKCEKVHWPSESNCLNISKERFHLNHYAWLLQTVLFSFGRGQRGLLKAVFSGSK